MSKLMISINHIPVMNTTPLVPFINRTLQLLTPIPRQPVPKRRDVSKLSYPNRKTPPTFKSIKASMDGLALSGIPEVDIQILIDLDIETFNNVSLTNIYIHNLLDNNFWRMRLERKYHVIATDMSRNYKYLNYALAYPEYNKDDLREEYKYYLIEEYKYDQMFVDAITSEDLFLVKLMLDNNLIPDIYNFINDGQITENSLSYALSTGNREMVKLILQYYNSDFVRGYELKDLRCMFENTPDYEMIMSLPQMK